MNGSEKYTTEDYAVLMEAATDVLLATVSSDGLGLVSFMREAAAGARFLDDAKARYENNALVVDLIAHTEAAQGDNPTSPDADMDRNYFVQQIDRIVSILQPDDTDAQEFKGFLWEFARHVAAAAGSGLLGSGDRISPEEQAFLDELRVKFGLPAPAPAETPHE